MRRAVIKKLFSLCAGLIGVLFAFMAFAEEANHGGQEQITFLHDWLPRLVNFGVLAIALGIVVWKFPRIQSFFRNRSADIARALQESQEARERALSSLAEMERKIKDCEIEIGRMISEARSRGEKEKLALIEDGKRAAQNIRSQAKQGIETELQTAKNALAAEAALLSLSLAEGRIKENISSADHERIVQEYISGVGGRG